MFYAQVDEEKICLAVSRLSGAVEAENLIEIPFFDTAIIGKKYVDGTWAEVDNPTTDPESDPESSRLDRIEEQLNALAAESVTVEKLEAAIMEGVNEV